MHTALLLASWLAASAVPAGDARVELTVKGSDTIGGELGPALARAYEAVTPGVSIHWEGLGSATAFPGLLDGSAQVGAASRAIDAKELAQAKELGVSLREYVLGYDGIAVVVNPTNPVARLDLDQLAALFTGEAADWSAVGGRPGPVRVVSRPSYSGTHGFFRDRVLRKGKKDSPATFPATALFVEKSEDVLREVARDPAAIGYVGMGTLRPGVTVVAVGSSAAGPFLKPDAETVRRGDYLIYRPLMLYTRGEPRGEVRRFLAWVLAGDGRKLIAAHDFIPGDVPETIRRTAEPDAGTAHAAASEPPRVFRIRFDYGKVALDGEARTTLHAVLEAARPSGTRLRVVGNADSAGSPEANRRVALARANLVADRLEAMGVAREAIRVDVSGSDAPLATNKTAAGRRENRRVDVHVVPGR
ncbi:MAG TPA: phosphate ABC transporter substrate-binding/OmpA family protein [Anaeromyxobacter sp.]|nr:phosphate ABC transporter substrate-binding/OmpA family protein [Anaeromyxobacter sp.]